MQLTLLVIMALQGWDHDREGAKGGRGRQGGRQPVTLIMVSITC